MRPNNTPPTHWYNMGRTRHQRVPTQNYTFLISTKKLDGYKTRPYTIRCCVTLLCDVIGQGTPSPYDLLTLLLHFYTFTLLNFYTIKTIQTIKTIKTLTLLHFPTPHQHHPNPLSQLHTALRIVYLGHDSIILKCL